MDSFIPKLLYENIKSTEIECKPKRLLKLLLKFMRKLPEIVDFLMKVNIYNV